MKFIVLKSIFIVCTILYVTQVSAQSSKNKHQKTKVFFLAGQSNMDGRAKAKKLSVKDRERLKKAKKNVVLYYNHQKPVALQETTFASHIQKKFGDEQLFGPELFFGIEMSEKYPNHKIILIKRSRGGMSLYGAWNPNWDADKATVMGEDKAPKLYSDFISYAHEILNGFDKKEYELSGMLWVQGEADSGNKKHGTIPADSYQMNLETLIEGVRTEFSMPNLPFVMFQVGSGNVVKGMKTIAERDPFVSLIPKNNNKNSKDFFERNPPPIGHYTYKSMKRIGVLFFENYQKNYLK